MNPELQDKLNAKHPEILHDMYIECGDGWYETYYPGVMDGIAEAEMEDPEEHFDGEDFFTWLSDLVAP